MFTKDIIELELKSLRYPKTYRKNKILDIDSIESERYQ
jgi:hypothetical protein